jgi:Gnt-I system high-affinity gluconate transporter
MHLLLVLFGILLLVLLITWAKINAFLSFLVVSILTGLLLGIPFDKIAGAVYKGIGDTLGQLAIVIVLGAMLGKIVAESGAAQRIATTMMNAFGEKYIQWALMITGFIIGIPLFYNVGFVLMVPLIFSVVYKYKLPAVYIGLPMLASLSVTHGFLPPHPAPAALVGLFHANMGKTLLFGDPFIRNAHCHTRDHSCRAVLLAHAEVHRRAASGRTGCGRKTRGAVAGNRQ